MYGLSQVGGNRIAAHLMHLSNIASCIYFKIPLLISVKFIGHAITQGWEICDWQSTYLIPPLLFHDLESTHLIPILF